MQPLRSFDDLTSLLKRSTRRVSLAVVCGSDEGASRAAVKAVEEGFASVVFVGHTDKVHALPWVENAPK